jgi:predicted metalloprotease
MGTILVYPKTAAEAAEIRAFLMARHIRLEELEPAETKEEALAGLREAVQEVKAMMRGEIKGQDFWEMLAELKAEQLEPIAA